MIRYAVDSVSKVDEAKIKELVKSIHGKELVEHFHDYEPGIRFFIDKEEVSDPEILRLLSLIRNHFRLSEPTKHVNCWRINKISLSNEILGID